MAHIESRKSGRQVNVDLNLVPFIDLMSVLITFLLISAVWTQVSMIQLGASFASPKDPDQADLPIPLKEDMVLKLEVTEAGYVLKVNATTKPIPKKDGEYDSETLVQELTAVKKANPEKPGIKIAIADEIQYEYVIKAMDAGMKSGFAPELLTGGPN